MNNIETIAKFQDVVQAAASRLVSCRGVGESSYVTTPLIYPSGSYIVVRVDRHGNDFFVTDFGMGFEEASECGAERTFRKISKSVAERIGVQFDGHTFFEVEVTEGQLSGAISAIANASLEAVTLTYMKTADQAHRDENAMLHDRLVSLFTAKFVARDVEILGGSNTKWHVSSLVSIEGTMTAFEAVSKHHISVVSTAAKFGDIARSDPAPARVAVVNSKQALGTWLGVLTPTASVVENTSPDSIIRRIVGIAA